MLRILTVLICRESWFQKALNSAVREAKTPKHISAHNLRLSIATHLLSAYYDICNRVQKTTLTRTIFLSM